MKEFAAQRERGVGSREERGRDSGAEADVLHDSSHTALWDAGHGAAEHLMPEAFDSMDIDAVLAMPPREGTRQRPQMEADLAAAQSVVERLIKQEESTQALDARFEQIKARFGLRHIGWKDLGTPQAHVALEINPKATVRLSDGSDNVFLLQGENLPDGLESKQSVKFTTGTSNHGHRWGIKMEADVLGPNHPQGFGPREQAGLMAPLPTNRKRHPGPTKHYVKGHLLNDNLGGPGLEHNLFPITEDANHKHLEYVERDVKRWVNEQGYFVHYHVAVKNIDESIDERWTDDSRNRVSAEFHCEAYVIDSSGERSNLGSKYINRVIHSIPDTPSYSTDKPSETAKGTQSGDQSHRNIVTRGEVELSTTKSRGGATHNDPNPVLIDKLSDLMSVASSEDILEDSLKSIVARTIASKIGGLSREQIKEAINVLVSDDWKTIVEESGYFGGVGGWNRVINRLSGDGNIAVVEDIISRFSATIDIFNKLDEHERSFLLVELNARERSLLQRMLNAAHRVQDMVAARRLVDQLDEVEHGKLEDSLGEDLERVISEGKYELIQNTVKQIRALLFQEGFVSARWGRARGDGERASNTFFQDGYNAYEGSDTQDQDYAEALSDHQEGRATVTMAISQRARDDYDLALERYRNFGPLPGTPADVGACSDYDNGCHAASTDQTSPENVGERQGYADYMSGVDAGPTSDCPVTLGGRQAYELFQGGVADFTPDSPSPPDHPLAYHAGWQYAASDSERTRDSRKRAASQADNGYGPDARGDGDADDDHDEGSHRARKRVRRASNTATTFQTHSIHHDAEYDGDGDVVDMEP